MIVRHPFDLQHRRTGRFEIRNPAAFFITHLVKLQIIQPKGFDWLGPSLSGHSANRNFHEGSR